MGALIGMPLASRTFGPIIDLPLTALHRIAETTVSPCECFLETFFTVASLPVVHAGGDVHAGVHLCGESLHGAGALEFECEIDGAFVAGEEVRVSHRHPICEFLDGFFQILQGGGFEHKTDSRGFFAGNKIAGKEHVLGPLRADEIGPHLSRWATHGADGRETNPSIIAGDDDIAEEDEVRAAGNAVAMDLTNDGFVHVEDGHPVALSIFEPP